MDWGNCGGFRLVAALVVVATIGTVGWVVTLSWKLLTGRTTGIELFETFWDMNRFELATIALELGTPGALSSLSAEPRRKAPRSPVDELGPDRA
jgi:hypothetical protein